MSFKASTSRAELLGGPYSAVVRTPGGWEGCSRWLIRKEGAVNPPIPPSWNTDRLETGAYNSFIGEAETGSAGSPVRGLDPPRPLLSGSWAQRLVLENENCALSAHVAAHIERCWPNGRWVFMAAGWVYRLGESIVGDAPCAIAMCISEPRWSTSG
jgi:hypothetical protein